MSGSVATEMHSLPKGAIHIPEASQKCPKKASTPKRSFVNYSRTLTSTQGRVHSLRPSKLRNHSKPILDHSSGMDSNPFAPNERCAPSTAAPAKALAVVFAVSKTNPARLSLLRAVDAVVLFAEM